MPNANNVQVNVVNGQGSCVPDELDLRGKSPNQEIVFTLTSPDWKFPAAAPYGIVINGNENGEFAAFNRVSDREVHVTDLNDDHGLHYYGVTLERTDGSGGTLYIDPTIRDQVD